MLKYSNARVVECSNIRIVRLSNSRIFNSRILEQCRFGIVESANVECVENIICRIVSDGNVWSTVVNTKSDVNIKLMIALRVSPAETQVDGLPPAFSGLVGWWYVGCRDVLI